METLGEKFQQTRERQGLSLEEIASQTRIPPHHLQALEEEDYSHLPAKVFAKGFVRSYARALGLDEDEALQLFLTSSSGFYDQNQPEQQPVQIKIEAGHRSRINWTLVLVIVGVVGALIFLLLPDRQDNFQPATEDMAPLPEARTPETNLSTPEPSETGSPEMAEAPHSQEDPGIDRSASTPVPAGDPLPVTPAVPVPPSPNNAQEANSSLALEIEAKQLTWVVVRSDNHPPKEALLQPGQKVTWEAEQQFMLTLGNAAGVDIRLNGEPQGPFGKPGQVVRDILLQP